MSGTWPVLRTVLLLLVSNCFMTAAWYGHLRYKAAPLGVAIAVSWLLALPGLPGFRVPCEAGSATVR